MDEVVRRGRTTALLALVAISPSSMAARALAADSTVGEELLRLWIVELLGGLLDKLAIVIEMAEEVGSQLVVGLARGTRIDVESDAKALKRVLDDVVVAIYHFLGSDALFACTDGDWHTMFVATAYKEYILALEAKIAHIDVRWHINARQVSDMYRTIGIRKGCGYKCSLK
jgi:hypothetical protein